MAESQASERAAAGSQVILAEVTSLLREDLADLEERLTAIERPDIPLAAEILDHVLAQRGKRVRPVLLMLTARLGSEWDRELVQSSALVVEIVHTATLLHDDCLDRATLRRGLPTVNEQWGDQAAILMGDFLYTKGFEILCRNHLLPVLRIVSRHTHRMSCGMNREFAGRHNPELEPEEYLRVIDEKTATLFAASCEVGSVLGGLPAEQAAALSEFGSDLGCAFQIVDDIFDFAGDPVAIGKPVGTDFRLGFATLPLIHALRHGDPEAAREVAAVFARGNVTAAEWEESRAFVLASGGIEAARERALAFAESARQRLAVLDGAPGTEHLFATVDYMVARGR